MPELPRTRKCLEQESLGRQHRIFPIRRAEAMKFRYAPSRLALCWLAGDTSAGYQVRSERFLRSGPGRARVRLLDRRYDTLVTNEDATLQGTSDRPGVADWPRGGALQPSRGGSAKMKTSSIFGEQLSRMQSANLMQTRGNVVFLACRANEACSALIKH